MFDVDVRLERDEFVLDVRTQFEPGVTALVGVSGAGKSTLLRVISGLECPNEGRIALDDKVWFDRKKRKNLSPRRRQIGYVFQEPRLVGHMSVRQNVELGHRRGGSVDNALGLTEVDQLLDRPVDGLSGGEKQRVMLARALAANPNVLILDEPFVGLDEVAKNDLINRLGVILPKLEIPVILVSHSFEEAAQLAKRFVHLDDGKVVSAGSAAQVLGRVTPAGSTTRRLSQRAHEQATISVLECRFVEARGMNLVRLSVGEQIVEAIVPSDMQAGVKGSTYFAKLWARDVILSVQPLRGISARNRLVGKVGDMRPLANGQVELTIAVEGQQLKAIVTSRSSHEMELKAGKPIFAIFKSSALEITQISEEISRSNV